MASLVEDIDDVDTFEEIVALLVFVSRWAFVQSKLHILQSMIVVVATTAPADPRPNFVENETWVDG